MNKGANSTLIFNKTLNNHERRCVHELAEELNLGSKSFGTGVERQVTVFRSKSR